MFLLFTETRITRPKRYISASSIQAPKRARSTETAFQKLVAFSYIREVTPLKLRSSKNGTNAPSP